MTATGTGPRNVPADLQAALDRVGEALAAMFTGDPAPYAALWAPGEQPTLFGAWGPTEQGHAAVVRTFTWVGSRFSDGVACRPRYRVVDWSGDLAYTVGVEVAVLRGVLEEHRERRGRAGGRVGGGHAEMMARDPRRPQAAGVAITGAGRAAPGRRGGARAATRRRHGAARA